jgi:hypothetical protein
MAPARTSAPTDEQTHLCLGIDHDKVAVALVLFVALGSS